LALGADLALDPTEDDVTAVMRTLTGPGAYGLGARVDVVFECSGAAPALATALKSVRTGGTVVLAGLSGSEIAVNIDRVVVKELRLQGTSAYRDEFATVIERLASGVLRSEDFVSHTYPLEEITAAFHTQMDPLRSVKVQVRPGA
jgi:L-idonate 5-dehydrogenase